jgi:hypothetical protein
MGRQALGLSDGSGALHALSLGFRQGRSILARQQAGGVCICRQDGQALGLVLVAYPTATCAYETVHLCYHGKAPDGLSV